MVLQCQSLYFMLEKELLFSRNRVFGLWKSELLRALNLVKLIIFLWNLARLSQSNACKKFCSSFCNLCCAVVINKNWKTWFPKFCREARIFLHCSKYLLILEKWKKIRTLAGIAKEKFRCKISKKNNSCLTEAPRGFRIFFKKRPGFYWTI